MRETLSPLLHKSAACSGVNTVEPARDNRSFASSQSQMLIERMLNIRETILATAVHIEGILISEFVLSVRSIHALR